MWIIKNNELKKFLTKGSNYREPRAINFSKALIETTTPLDKCIEGMTLTTNCTTSKFKTGKEKVLAWVKEQIEELRQQIKTWTKKTSTEWSKC